MKHQFSGSRTDRTTLILYLKLFRFCQPIQVNHSASFEYLEAGPALDYRDKVKETFLADFT
jgi:hypothetical protein